MTVPSPRRAIAKAPMDGSQSVNGESVTYTWGKDRINEYLMSKYGTLNPYLDRKGAGKTANGVEHRKPISMSPRRVAR